MTTFTVLEFLDRCPPWLCRLLARERRKALTKREIAARSGLSPGMISKLSKLRSFGGVDVDVASRYMKACNIDPFHMRVHRQMIKRNMWNHLVKHWARGNPKHLAAILPPTSQ